MTSRCNTTPDITLYPPPQVLPLPVHSLPAPLAARPGGLHLQLRGHPDELPGLLGDAPAAHQSGPEEAVQRPAQPPGELTTTGVRQTDHHRLRVGWLPGKRWWAKCEAHISLKASRAVETSGYHSCYVDVSFYVSMTMKSNFVQWRLQAACSHVDG